MDPSSLVFVPPLGFDVAFSVAKQEVLALAPESQVRLVSCSRRRRKDEVCTWLLSGGGLKVESVLCSVGTAT